MKRILFILLSGFLFYYQAFAQVRREYSISDGWKFKQGGWAYAEMERFDDSKWETVSLPQVFRRLSIKIF